MFYIDREEHVGTVMPEAIHLAAYLPRKQNKLVDQLTRTFSEHHQWSLLPGIAISIFQLWGTSQVYLFATKSNRKCHQFCSRGGLSPGLLTNAFLLPWSDTLLPSGSLAAQSVVQSQTKPCASHPYSTGVAPTTLALNPTVLLNQASVVSHTGAKHDFSGS